MVNLRGRCETDKWEQETIYAYNGSHPHQARLFRPLVSARYSHCPPFA